MTRRPLLLAGVLIAVAAVTFAVAYLLVTVFTHKQEERKQFVRLVEVNEISTDPVPWGVNWPWQFDTYKRTVDVTQTRYGGSSAMPESKLDAEPWLKRLYANYAFSLDYRQRRGHAYMLKDQEETERVTKRPQAGACLHCHASMTPTWRRIGLEDMGQPADAEALGKEFNWPAVMRGFDLVSQRPYFEVRDEVLKTPDGTPDENEPLFPGGEPSGGEADATGEAHPVSCIDCHDPETMKIRVTRPGFMRGIAILAASEEPMPHLPSIERWRQGDRSRDYDPNVDADRAEMRSFVCGQCHVEYYCANKMTLTFPWGKGLKVEQIEQFWDETRFPDGTPFYDFEHGETGAHVYKAQHPEFELWNQGVHARSGVACADCHMPYERQGAMKVSNHWVRSPLLSVNTSCQPCHTASEAELQSKVATIQDRTKALLDRAAVAMTDMLDAIGQAKESGATPDQLAPILELQKKAMWRLDFVSSENSMGFHADQETARILGESIDYSRQAEAAALRLRAGPGPAYTPVDDVQGVTPKGEAPKGAPEAP